MNGGFSFCGVDIYDLGLEYAPELKNTYVYKPTSYKVADQSFDGHAGGYYYGSTPNPKDITLRCYYEQSDIREGIMSRIFDCFKQGKTGKLIFAQRPWCWYIATVINLNTDQLLNVRNGLITIQMRIYYPYARSNVMCITDYVTPDPGDPIKYDIICNSGVLNSPSKIPSVNLINNEEMNFENNSNPFILYNPGSERAKVAIEIAGDVGNGVIITNKQTNQSCKIVGLSKSLTTNVGKWLVVDSLNGKTILTDGDQNNDLAFLYHDSGFIELEPAFPIIRRLEANTVASSNTIVLDADVSEDIIGKYIHINNSWKKIISRPTSKTIIISSNAGITDVFYTDIVLMNEIVVSPVTTMALTKLNFSYSPTYL